MSEHESVGDAPAVRGPRRLRLAVLALLVVVAVVAGLLPVRGQVRPARSQSRDGSEVCEWIPIGALPRAVFFAAAAVTRSGDHETIWVHGGLTKGATSSEAEPVSDLYRLDLPVAGLDLRTGSLEVRSAAPSGVLPERWGHTASVVRRPDGRPAVLIAGGAAQEPAAPTATAEPIPSPVLTLTPQPLGGTADGVFVPARARDHAADPAPLSMLADVEARGQVFEFVPDEAGDGRIDEVLSSSAFARIHAAAVTVIDSSTGRDAVLVMGGRRSLRQAPDQTAYALVSHTRPYVAARDVIGPLRMDASVPFYGHSLVTRASPEEMFLFGGAREGGSGLSSLYRVRLEGSLQSGLTLRPMSVAGARPLSRVFHAATYDSSRGRMVVFSGLEEDGLTDTRKDAWVLEEGSDGFEWRTMGRPASNPGLYGASMVYSVDHQAPILIGGRARDADPSNDIVALYCYLPTPTPTDTATATSTVTPTSTDTPRPTPSPESTLTPTQTPSPTASPSDTGTPTASATATWTPSPSPTMTASSTPEMRPMALLPYVFRAPVAPAKDSRWQACGTVEQEPNDSLAQAAGTPNRLLESTWTCGLLSARGDVRDFYRFTVDRPMEIIVFLSDIPAGHRHDLRLYVREGGEPEGAIWDLRSSDPPAVPGEPTPALPDPWRTVKNVTASVQPGWVYYVEVVSIATRPDTQAWPPTYLLRWSEPARPQPLSRGYP